MADIHWQRAIHVCACGDNATQALDVIKYSRYKPFKVLELLREPGHVLAHILSQDPKEQ